MTIVRIPDVELEQDRDLMRSRQNLLQQQKELRKHPQALLRKNGLHYKAPGPKQNPLDKTTLWLEISKAGRSVIRVAKKNI